MEATAQTNRDSTLVKATAGLTALYAIYKGLVRASNVKGQCNAKGDPKGGKTPTEIALGLFEKHFGGKGENKLAQVIAAKAPGRVNLIGEHVDYNMGFVMPIAINKYTAVVGARCADDDKFTLVNGRADGTVVKLDWNRSDFFENSRPVKWHNYVRGVAALFESDRKVKVPGFRAVVVGNVPLGGGLSSSAALEVATATFLENLCKASMNPVEKAQLCQKVEHTWCGVPCGIMDQYASVFGEEQTAMLIDCKSLSYEAVPIRDGSIAFLIVNSNVKHALVDGAYKKRKASCDSVAAKLQLSSLRELTPAQLEVEWKGRSEAKEALTELEYRRAKHVVNEIDRTSRAAALLKTNKYEAMGQLMNQSHASLRDLYEVSCPELDVLVKTAQGTDGVYGARMTGAGFGGSIVVLLKTSAVETVKIEIQRKYKEFFSSAGKEAIEPTFLLSPASEGASAVLHKLK